MLESQLPVLLPCICVLFLSTVALMRIVYIFLTDKEMRRLQSYRIMANIGLYQVIIGGAYISEFASLSHSSLHQQLETIFTTLETTAFHAVIGNEFVLALNRVSIICSVRIPSFLIIALQMLILLFAVLRMLIMNSNLAGYVISTDGHTRSFDFSKPYTKAMYYVGFIHYMTAIGLTLVCYVIILIFLKYKKQNNSSWSLDRAEWKIAVQSCIYFLAELFLFLCFVAVCRNYIPYSDVVAFGYRMLEMFVCVCLPSIIYLSLNSALRAKFLSPLRRLKSSRIQSGVRETSVF